MTNSSVLDDIDRDFDDVMASQALDRALTAAASHHALPLALLRALAHVESGSSWYAVRYEPDYRWLWDGRNNRPYRGDPEQVPPPAEISSTSSTEWVLQCCSLGPLQIMGATARELGYRKWLTALCGLDGVEYACRYLVRQRERFYHPYGWSGVVAAYNAGSVKLVVETGRFKNATYVDRVSVAVEKFGGERLVR